MSLNPRASGTWDSVHHGRLPRLFQEIVQVYQDTVGQSIAVLDSCECLRCFFLYLQSRFRVLPHSSVTLSHNLVPLTLGHIGLPQFEVSCLSQPKLDEKILRGASANLPTGIFVRVGRQTSSLDRMLLEKWQLWEAFQLDFFTFLQEPS